MAQPVGEALLGQVQAARAALSGLPGLLSRVGSDELPELAAAAAGAVAAACAAQAAVVLEAENRGVIAESDHPRVPAWVQQSHVEAGVPVSPSRARALGALARICDRQDAAPLREAVLEGRVTIEAADLLAGTYRRLQGSIAVTSWDGVMDALIRLAAHGVNRRELAAMEERSSGSTAPSRNTWSGSAGMTGATSPNSRSIRGRGCTKAACGSTPRRPRR